MIALNIYSSFKSIRATSKTSYPFIYNLLNKKINSLQLKFICPFCREESKENLFRRTKPEFDDIGILFRCKCELPKKYDDYKININKINKLLNKRTDIIELKFDDDIFERLELIINNNFSELYNFDENDITLFEDEKEYVNKYSVDKQVWAKVKSKNYDFNIYEYNKLKKIPNALINGIQAYNLRKALTQLSLKMNSSSKRKGNIDLVVCDIYVNSDVPLINKIEKLNPQFVKFIENYKSKDTLPQEKSNCDEILALGHFCKSNNLLMDDLCQFISLVDFCKNYNLELSELKEIVSQNR